MPLRVLSILIILTLGGIALAQTPPSPGGLAAVVRAAELDLAYKFPNSVSTVQHQQTKLADGTLLDRFSASRDQNFRCEISFIHKKRDLGEISIWATLGQITRQVVSSSKLKVSEFEHTWVDDLPSLRFLAQRTNGTINISTRGQFTLCPDGLVFCQTVSTRNDKGERLASLAFFDSVKRPGVKKPRGYQISLGEAEITYPPGILPHLRDGFLQLEDIAGETGLLICREDGAPNNRSEMICALAESLDSMTSKSVNPLALKQGPGKIAGLPAQSPAWGFSGRLETAGKAEGTTRSKDVFVRYYQIKGQRIFVSAYAMVPESPEKQKEAIMRVKAMLDSIKAKTRP